MAQRANSQSEQTQGGKRLGHIPAKCVVLHVNHQKITNHYAVHGGNKNWFSQENCQWEDLRSRLHGKSWMSVIKCCQGLDIFVPGIEWFGMRIKTSKSEANVLIQVMECGISRWICTVSKTTNPQKQEVLLNMFEFLNFKVVRLQYWNFAGRHWDSKQLCFFRNSQWAPSVFQFPGT